MGPEENMVSKLQGWKVNNCLGTAGSGPLSGDERWAGLGIYLIHTLVCRFSFSLLPLSSAHVSGQEWTLVCPLNEILSLSFIGSIPFVYKQCRHSLLWRIVKSHAFKLALEVLCQKCFHFSIDVETLGSSSYLN